MSNTKIKNNIGQKFSKDELMAKFGNNKSAVIRFLAAQAACAEDHGLVPSDFTVGRIKDFLGLSHQHVYNTVNRPLKKVVEEVIETAEAAPEVTVVSGEAAKEILSKRPKTSKTK